MLRAFRKRQSLVKGVLWCVLVLVCVSMVITLIPGMGGNTGDSTLNPVVAEVEGDRITVTEVQQSVQQVGLRSRIPPEMMPFYTNQVLNEMILEKASVAEAARLGLKVDKQELLSQLKKDSTLFPGGKFIGQEPYENLVINQMGMNVAQFEERYRRSLLMNKLRLLVTDALTVTPDEIRVAFIKENEKVALDYILLYPADFMKEIGDPSEAQMQEYFNKNKERYQIPEKRSVKVLLVDKDKIGVTATATDAEVKKIYETRIDTYRLPERVSVRHILFKADPKDPAKLADAKKKADDLLKKLKAGADFAEMAKQNSEDPGTAPGGGMLAGIVRKQTVPEFEAVAFSIQPNALSEPVQTTYGIHIIKGVSHDQARLQPLDEVKATIQKEIKDEKIRASLTDAAEQAASALGNTPADIGTVAAKLHGEVVDFPPFAKGEILPRIGQSDAFMEQVFSLEKNRAGAAISVTAGYAVPVLADVYPSRPAALPEVKEQVKKDYILDLAKEKLISKAGELAKLVEQQKDIKKASQGMKLTVKTSSPVTREGTIPGLGSVKDMDSKMFTLPTGGIGGPVTVGEGRLVYQVASREEPKEEELAVKKPDINSRLLNAKRQLAFDVFQDNLKSKLVAAGRIKINQEALVQVSGVAGTTP